MTLNWVSDRVVRKRWSGGGLYGLTIVVHVMGHALFLLLVGFADCLHCPERCAHHSVTCAARSCVLPCARTQGGCLAISVPVQVCYWVLGPLLGSTRAGGQAWMWQ